MAVGAGSDDADKARRFRDAALPHLDDVYTLARYLLHNAADADDAVQECYLRAFRHFEALRGPAIKPWLLAILRNVCRAEFARRSGVVAAGVGAEVTEEASPLWREAEDTPETEMLASMGRADDPPAGGGAAGPIPRGDRAARDQRPVLSRHCRRSSARRSAP